LKGSPSTKSLNTSLLNETAEKNLYQSFLETKARIEPYLARRDYPQAVSELTGLRKPIDDFFSGVMVMVEDKAVRGNRLALLDQIGQLFLRIADFSKLT
jgi:glycyl-tRNA synthetase beta chain